MADEPTPAAPAAAEPPAAAPADAALQEVTPRTAAATKLEAAARGQIARKESASLRKEPPAAAAAAPPPAAPAPAPAPAPRLTVEAPALASASVYIPASPERNRELMQRQAEVDRLADAARSREELMEQRQLNQVLHAELQTLRQTMEARERVVEQISSDAAHVDTSNIDLPELQRRHRMLGAAYRSDRRRMDQLGHQVAQLQAALGTQEQLQAAYAQLKEAHRSQSLQMQRLQEEASKVGRYRHTAKQQELVIQKLETMMQSALRDAKKAKGFEPQLESLKGQLKVAESELQKQRDTVLPAVTEEQVKLLMRAERAERRASAIEEEMTEAARQNAREIANLKLKLAEKEAQLMGGFGSSANLVLGELPGLGNSDEPRRDRGGLPPRHPSGGARRQSPRLDPLPTGGM